MTRQFFGRIVKYLLISVAIVAVMIILIFFRYDYFSSNAIFNIGLTIGSMAIFFGLWSSLFSPDERVGADGSSSGTRWLGWLDFKNQESLSKAHRNDRPKISKLIYVGIGIVLITAMVQFLFPLVFG